MRDCPGSSSLFNLLARLVLRRRYPLCLIESCHPLVLRKDWRSLTRPGLRKAPPISNHDPVETQNYNIQFFTAWNLDCRLQILREIVASCLQYLIIQQVYRYLPDLEILFWFYMFANMDCRCIKVDTLNDTEGNRLDCPADGWSKSRR